MDPIVITLAFGLGFLASRVDLPPLVGYLVAGLALHLLGFEPGPMIQTLSDMGVTLLLFTIGLKLKVRSLLRPEVWAGATLHMAFTVAIFGGALFALSTTGLTLLSSLDLRAALVLGFGLSFSSTVFAVKILEESKRSGSLNGRTAIGVLIVQDIVAVLFLTASTGKLPSLWAFALLAALPVARLVFLRLLDRMGHGELQVLFGFFLALAAGAAAFDAVGLKPDLGALIMGMLLAPHPRAGEMADSLLNIKDLLLVGFFLDIGLSGLPGASGWIMALALVLVVPLKAAGFLALFTRFRLKARTAFITSANLANYSEFGLIVCSLSASAGWIDREWLVIMAIALSLSFITAAPLNRNADRLFSGWRDTLKRLETRQRHPEEEAYERGPWQIGIVGMGRVGTGAYDTFRERFGDIILGIDFSATKVDAHLEQGRSVIEADVADPDFWRRLPMPDGTLKLLVLTLPSLEAQLFIARQAREFGYAGEIAAVAFFDDEVEALRAAGVDTAFNIYGEAGSGLAAHVCDTVEFCVVPGRPPAA
ncbi:cation:proton antiporter family protein [Pseudodesulfovibrio tunisiensis]|uniref:cation:proton antiporter family protein n=1 Tax=Pseudodesulfovibrio tunisiensis TaxID=463192 RepID=UPI001FB44D26|nr:cation:proton antiporter family protein [Pseudodesulfovibrio tunisiensis]